MDIRTRENVSINIDRFTFNNTPVCSALNVSKDSKNRMVCIFLKTRRFGTEFICNFLEEILESDSLIVPHTNCPLWRDKDAASESVEH